MEICYSCVMQLLSTLGLFGSTLTIFYQKDFAFRGHVGSRLKSTFSLLLLWTFLISCKNTFVEVMVVVVVSVITFVFVAWEIRGLALEEKIKSLVLTTSALFCTIFPRDVLACFAVLCAMTQLLRWPINLKNRLRELRIIFGPVYPILLAGANIHTGLTSNLLTLSSCMALVAAIFFRPDNEEVLKLVKSTRLSVPSQKTRKLAHGFLMVASLVCVMVHLTMSPNVHRTILAGTMFVGGLGLLLYVFVAELPRKLYRVYITRDPASRGSNTESIDRD